MVIIKIGGGKTINIEGIAKNISQIKGPKIIIHGANSYRDELAVRLGIEREIITSASGYTSVYSDENLIDLQMMVYAGLRNKRIVEMFQKNGQNAIGLSGIDGQLVRGRRNNGIRVRDKGKLKVLRDYSGKPKEINKELLDSLLKINLIPVITVPIIDEKGYAINSENDDIIVLMNNAFNPDLIVHFIESPGLLKNSEEENSLITKMLKEDLILWEEKAVGRIKRKVHAINKLFAHNSPKVIIADGREENPIDNILNNRGTVIE